MRLNISCSSPFPGYRAEQERGVGEETGGEQKQAKEEKEETDVSTSGIAYTNLAFHSEWLQCSVSFLPWKHQPVRCSVPTHGCSGCYAMTSHTHSSTSILPSLQSVMEVMVMQ